MFFCWFTLSLLVAAFCRNSVDGQWYSYDDSSVEPVPQGEVCTRGAYILFYQRRNTIPPWSASSSVTGQSFKTLCSSLLSCQVKWKLLSLCSRNNGGDVVVSSHLPTSLSTVCVDPGLRVRAASVFSFQLLTFSSCTLFFALLKWCANSCCRFHQLLHVWPLAGQAEWGQ